jgi:hypothetical protein
LCWREKLRKVKEVGNILSVLFGFGMQTKVADFSITSVLRLQYYDTVYVLIDWYLLCIENISLFGIDHLYSIRCSVFRQWGSTTVQTNAKFVMKFQIIVRYVINVIIVHFWPFCCSIMKARIFWSDGKSKIFRAWKIA